MTEHEFYLEEVITWIIMAILYVISSRSRKRVGSSNL